MCISIYSIDVQNHYAHISKIFHTCTHTHWERERRVSFPDEATEVKEGSLHHTCNLWAKKVCVLSFQAYLHGFSQFIGSQWIPHLLILWIIGETDKGAYNLNFCKAWRPVKLFYIPLR